jgi:hypothetical protein
VALEIYVLMINDRIIRLLDRIQQPNSNSVSINYNETPTSTYRLESLFKLNNKWVAEVHQYVAFSHDLLHLLLLPDLLLTHYFHCKQLTCGLLSNYMLRISLGNGLYTLKDFREATFTYDFEHFVIVHLSLLINSHLTMISIIIISINGI